MFRNKLIYTVLCVSLALVSCSKEVNVELSEDPGYAENPLKSLSVKDGENWIPAEINPETHEVSFTFHALDDLKSVSFKAELENDWVTMISPDELEFEMNLVENKKIVVNDGVDDITYQLHPSVYQLVASASASVNSEKQLAEIAGHLISLKFQTVYDPSDFSSFALDLQLNADAELVSPSSLEGMDLSEGEKEIIIKDKISGINKTYTLIVSTGDLINVSAGWKDITTSLVSEKQLQLSTATKVYKNSALNGAKDNIAYAIAIPAGKVQMKIAAKELVSDPRVSSVLCENRDYSVFLPFQGPNCWGKDNSHKEYYSPAVFGSDGSAKKVLRTDGWNGKTKMYAPALAIKDGILSMEYASADKASGVFMKYDNVQGEGGVSWTDVDAAFGGYFQIVKDGNVLISSEGYEAYQQYTETYRTYVPLIYATPSWKYDSIIKHDAMRTGRIGIGCTEKGDLILFMSDKCYNSHNQGQGKDVKHQGALSEDQKLNKESQIIPDTRGVTLYELANVMKDLGCSDVMTAEDYNWAYITLQDGQDRGYDLVQTNSRWDFKTGLRKDSPKEFPNMFVVCFK